MLLIHGPVMEAGSFPWGLLIIAGLIYLVWNKGACRPWGRGYDNRQMPGGPQALFEQWHREAHQAAQPYDAPSQGAQPYATQPQAPAAPAAPADPTSAGGPGTLPSPQSPQSPMPGSSGPLLERW